MLRASDSHLPPPGLTPRSLGDRRGRPRLHVVGSLRGTFETTTSARLVNIGRGGALVAGPAPLVPHSIHNIMLTVGGYEVRLDVRVRHVHFVAQASTSDLRYELGLEFLSSPEALDIMLARNAR
jgi:hypothetical protein